MSDPDLKQKLQRLKEKQKFIDNVWEKAGNRELLQFFVELIPKALGVERCSIFVVDPETDKLWLQSGTNVSEKEIVVAADDSLVGRAITSGTSQVENDMGNQIGSHDLIAMKTGFSVHNAMAVPVRGVSTGKITGAIEVLNKRGGKQYSDEDREILEKLAFHAQLNLENLYIRQEMAAISEEMGKKIEMLEKKLRQ
jgi:Nif-specific regulatory protein/two-component system response regulator HydG